MKTNILIFFLIAGVGGILGWYFSQEDSPQTAEAPSQKEAASPAEAPLPDRSMASVKPAHVSPGHSNYMKELLAEDTPRMVYERTQEIFKSLPQKEALARWIALGLRFDSSKDFGQEFETSLAGLNENPEEVLEAIAQTYSKLGNDDAFIQTMLINVVHQLKVSKDEKISFYSERLGDKFVLDEKGEPTASSLNITNSMAFLKQYISDTSSVKAKIEASLSEHRSDKRSQRELAQRFAAYFPELESDISRWSDQ